MSDPVKEWIAPAGMIAAIEREWRTFYRHIFTSYGVSPKQYRALYLAQLGRCYICQTARGKHPDDPKGGGNRRLGVDHNHALGNRIEAVRGLLCSGGPNTCNRIIGWLDYAALRRAADYLERAPAQTVFAAVGAGQTDDRIQGMVYHP